MARLKYREPADLPAKRGRPSTGGQPSRSDLYRLYIREGKSIREVAEALNCSKDMVARALKAYGIEARVNIKRSQLREFPREKLKAEVTKKGVRGLSRELGIHENTLRNYIKKQ